MKNSSSLENFKTPTIYFKELNHINYKLNEEYSNLIWSMKRSFAQELLSMTEEKLANEINHAFVSLGSFYLKIKTFSMFITKTKRLKKIT